MTHATLLLVPVLLQVALTFALLFRLGPARVAALRRGEVRLEDVALGQSAWPPDVTQISNAFANQLQLPLLFYTAVLIALVTRKVDVAMVAGAWLFVASRLVHAYIHVTTNHVPRRFRAYAIGAFTLAAIWIWLAARILLEGA